MSPFFPRDLPRPDPTVFGYPDPEEIIEDDVLSPEELYYKYYEEYPRADPFMLRGHRVEPRRYHRGRLFHAHAAFPVMPFPPGPFPPPVSPLSVPPSPFIATPPPPPPGFFPPPDPQMPMGVDPAIYGNVFAQQPNMMNIDPNMMVQQDNRNPPGADMIPPNMLQEIVQDVTQTLEGEGLLGPQGQPVNISGGGGTNSFGGDFNQGGGFGGGQGFGGGFNNQGGGDQQNDSSGGFGGGFGQDGGGDGGGQGGDQGGFGGGGGGHHGFGGGGGGGDGQDFGDSGGAGGDSSGGGGDSGGGQGGDGQDSGGDQGGGGDGGGHHDGSKSKPRHGSSKGHSSHGHGHGGGGGGKHKGHGKGGHGRGGGHHGHGGHEGHSHFAFSHSMSNNPFLDDPYQQYSHERRGHIRIHPNSYNGIYEAGETISVTGHGFDPGELVTVQLYTLSETRLAGTGSTTLHLRQRIGNTVTTTDSNGNSHEKSIHLPNLYGKGVAVVLIGHKSNKKIIERITVV